MDSGRRSHRSRWSQVPPISSNYELVELSSFPALGHWRVPWIDSRSFSIRLRSRGDGDVRTEAKSPMPKNCNRMYVKLESWPLPDGVTNNPIACRPTIHDDLDQRRPNDQRIARTFEISQQAGHESSSIESC